MDLFQMECNHCHCHGDCIRYGSYRRSYLLHTEDLSSGSGSGVRIQRVLCKRCGHTHALLPEEIIPYAQFSMIFVLAVLFLYYARPNGESVATICTIMGIAPPQLYRWKIRFEKQKDIFLGVIKSALYPGLKAVEKLRGFADYGKEFCSLFLTKTEKMPMQTHRNAPNTRRPVMYWNHCLPAPTRRVNRLAASSNI